MISCLVAKVETDYGVVQSDCFNQAECCDKEGTNTNHWLSGKNISRCSTRIDEMCCISFNLCMHALCKVIYMEQGRRK